MNGELRARILAYNAAKRADAAERDELRERLSVAAQRVAAIQANALYELLPRWIKSKIESILDN